MKAISIYALTRNQNMECVQKLERQLSGRDFFAQDQRMGTGKYESTGEAIGTAYGGSV